MKIWLRPAVDADAQFCLSTGLSLDSETYDAPANIDAMLSMIRHDRVFVTAVSEKSGERYADVGFVSVRQINRWHIYISELAIGQPFQGRGIGELVFDMTISMLMADGFTKFTLHTHPENVPALRIYESFGFVTLSHCRSYGRRRTPRLFMRMSVD